MEQNIQKLFKQSSYTPESKLSNDIWGIIESKNTNLSKWKTFGYLSLGILSLSGSIFSIKSLIEEFTKLGFFDYLTLVFSDSGVIATYWKEYTLVLADSLPITSLMISLFLLFVLFISIRRISFNMKGRFRIA